MGNNKEIIIRRLPPKKTQRFPRCSSLQHFASVTGKQPAHKTAKVAIPIHTKNAMATGLLRELVHRNSSFLLDSLTLRKQSCSSFAAPSPSRNESARKLTKILTFIDTEHPLRTHPCVRFPHCFDVPDASRISHREVCHSVDIVGIFRRFVFHPLWRQPRPSTRCMHLRNVVQRFVFPRRSAFREGQAPRQVISAGACYAKIPTPVVFCCSPVRCCISRAASALDHFDPRGIALLFDCHLPGCSLMRSSRMTNFPMLTAARTSLPTFRLHFLRAASNRANATIRQFFFCQIHECATVDANI